MNPEKSRLADILKNEEYRAIIAAIGAGVGAEFNLDDSQYGKVIIMTDADTDGAHIQVLLLTFFYRYMRPLIDHGRVYIAQPPLFKITRRKGKTTDSAICLDGRTAQRDHQRIGRGV